MIRYAKYFDSNKTMSFKVNDEELFRKYTEILEKISSSIGKKFDCEPVYGHNEKYIKTKINSYGDKVITNFQGKKVPKEETSYKCVSLIMLDSFTRLNKYDCPQTLLKECKYEIKSNKMENLINNNLDPTSSDNYGSGNKSDDESDNDKSKKSSKNPFKNLIMNLMIDLLEIKSVF